MSCAEPRGHVPCVLVELVHACRRAGTTSHVVRLVSPLPCEGSASPRASTRRADPWLVRHGAPRGRSSGVEDKDENNDEAPLRAVSIFRPGLGVRRAPRLAANKNNRDEAPPAPGVSPIQATRCPWATLRVAATSLVPPTPWVATCAVADAIVPDDPMGSGGTMGSGTHMCFADPMGCGDPTDCGEPLRSAEPVGCGGRTGSADPCGLCRPYGLRRHDALR